MKFLRLVVSSIILSIPSFAIAGSVSQGPTYAPGGHAIIPTAPAAAPRYFAPRPAPTQTYVVPTYPNGSTPPALNYAPGGHAIIPSVPQAPTFSPSFTTPSSPQITSPTTAGPSHQTIQPPTIQSSTRPPVASHPSFSGSGVSTLPTSSQSLPNQITGPSVGQIPAPTSGRLPLTPITGNTTPTSFGSSGIANSTPAVIGNAGQRPLGIPDTWQIQPTQFRSGESSGGQWFSPKAGSDTGVRAMPANPNSPNPEQQVPYVIQQRNGVPLDKYGNPVLKDSPEAHIPQSEYEFNPEFFIE
jgi:hypothetical protein